MSKLSDVQRRNLEKCAKEPLRQSANNRTMISLERRGFVEWNAKPREGGIGHISRWIITDAGREALKS